MSQWRKLTLSASILLATTLVNAQAVKEYEFMSDATYPINTGLGVVTQIEINPREDVKDFSTGLSNGWELMRRDNVFYIKPKDRGVDTNMIVRTGAHNYIFELRVVSSTWKNLEQAKNDGINYKVKFRYPEGTEFNTPEISDSGFSLDYNANKKYNTSYDVAAPDSANWLVPLRVYDDGKFTYVHLKQSDEIPSGNFPTIYGRKERNGEEFVVNTTVEGNIIVVHGTYPVLVLRHGETVVGLRRN